MAEEKGEEEMTKQTFFMKQDLKTELWKVSVGIPMLEDENIPAQALRLYLRLLGYARERVTCFPSRKVLASAIHISESQVDRLKNKLRELGLLDWKQRKGKDGRLHNIYMLLKYQPIKPSRDAPARLHKAHQSGGNNTNSNYYQNQEKEKKEEETRSIFKEEIKNQLLFDYNKAIPIFNKRLDGIKFNRFTSKDIKNLEEYTDLEDLKCFVSAIPDLDEFANHYSWYCEGRELPSNISPSLFLKLPDRMEELVVFARRNE